MVLYMRIFPLPLALTFALACTAACGDNLPAGEDEPVEFTITTTAGPGGSIDPGMTVVVA